MHILDYLQAQQRRIDKSLEHDKLIERLMRAPETINARGMIFYPRVYFNDGELEGDIDLVAYSPKSLILVEAKATDTRDLRHIKSLQDEAVVQLISGRNFIKRFFDIDPSKCYLALSISHGDIQVFEPVEAQQVYANIRKERCLLE